MTVENTDDAPLIEACTACRDAYAHYLRGCEVFADAEAKGIEPPAEGGLWWMSIRWLEAMRRVSHIPAQTRSGLMAKGVVYRDYFAERTPDEDGSELLASLLSDMARVLS